jgi:glycosyltransferase involved in cell wall biosynthesis
MSLKLEKKPLFSIVVPTYGCETCLFSLYSRLKNTLETISSSFEIILINDCSPDGAWEAIKQLAEIDPRVKGINLSRNFGQHIAITAGLDQVQGDWIVVMDCDLQDQPEEIPNLYAKTLDGFDIVLAQRTKRQDTFFKRLTSTAFYQILSYLTDTYQDGSIANFGMYHYKVIRNVTQMRERMRFFPIMVRWTGFKTTFLPVQHDARAEGKSGYSLKKLIYLATDTIIAFSDKPLRLSIKLGLTISFLSLMAALIIIVRALLGFKGITGWPSLIVSVWFTSGMIIFLLGVIGIYVARIFQEVIARPLYIIDEIYAQPVSTSPIIAKAVS